MNEEGVFIALLAIEEAVFSGCVTEKESHCKIQFIIYTPQSLFKYIEENLVITIDDVSTTKSSSSVANKLVENY